MWRGGDVLWRDAERLWMRGRRGTGKLQGVDVQYVLSSRASNLQLAQKKHEHIPAVLTSLHWLPEHFRIHFKVISFVLTSLISLRCCTPTLSRSLRSSASPKSWTKASRGSLLLLKCGMTCLWASDGVLPVCFQITSLNSSLLLGFSHNLRFLVKFYFNLTNLI